LLGVCGGGGVVGGGFLPFGGALWGWGGGGGGGGGSFVWSFVALFLSCVWSVSL